MENSLGGDAGKVGLVSWDQKGGDLDITEIDGDKGQLGIKELGESGVREHKDQPKGGHISQNQHEETILPDNQSDIRCLLPPEEDPGTLGNSGF